MADPYYQDNHATIYLGDCREILPQFGQIDAVVTDPPYGVGLGKIKSAIGKTGYTQVDDTRENVRNVVIPIVYECIRLATCVLITPGPAALFDYPEPDNLGCIYFPSGSGRNSWGFTCSQPLLYYGVDPYLKNGLGGRADSFQCTEISDKNGHPCPKPIKLMVALVNRVSLSGNTILDPFMGSGTTLRAAKDLGRKAIGIEIEEKYCEIAVERLRQEVLFAHG
tara:strand:- start:140 stop:808 length:669 start_codon:yes stop_codon:yes gene_type:complete